VAQPSPFVRRQLTWPVVLTTTSLAGGAGRREGVARPGRGFRPAFTTGGAAAVALYCGHHKGDSKIVRWRSTAGSPRPAKLASRVDRAGGRNYSACDCVRPGISVQSVESLPGLTDADWARRICVAACADGVSCRMFLCGCSGSCLSMLRSRTDLLHQNLRTKGSC
jgi:hypothetical protein